MAHANTVIAIRKMGAVAAVPAQDESVDTSKDPTIQTHVRYIYGIGIAVWVFLFLLLTGVSLLRTIPHVLIGCVFALLLLGANIFTAQFETIGTYPAERQEVDRVERNAFYLVAGIFAFSGMFAGLERSTIKVVLPFLMMTVFFAICMCLSPVWLSTVDAEHSIYAKHIKTVFMSYAVGFIVTALSVVFFHSVGDNGIGRRVWHMGAQNNTVSNKKN